MNTQQYRVGGETITAHHVESPEDLRAALDWDGDAVSRGVIRGLDTETTGLDLWSAGFKVRLLQFGDANTVFTIPVGRGGAHAEAARTILSRGRFWIHKAPYDVLALDRVGLATRADLHPRTLDTRILAHLADPRTAHEGGTGHSLKDLAQVYVDPEAKDAQKELQAEFRRLKATVATGWALIDDTHPDYLRYAALDVALLLRVAARLGQHSKENGFTELALREHRLQRLTTAMQHRGMLVDRDYLTKLAGDLGADEERFKAVAAQFGVDKIGSPKQVAAALVAMGEELTETTDSGALAVGKEILLPMADLSPAWERLGIREPNPLADAVVRAKRAGKWKTAYVDTMLETSDFDGRIHPWINSLQARTARMCLPESERLVTQRGNLHINDVVVGDMTIDATGDWVEVKAVHRYDEAEVFTYRPRERSGRAVKGLKVQRSVRSTAEHRWLQRSDRGVVSLRKVTGRATLLMAPPAVDVFSTSELRTGTAAERIATMVALLCTDGRLAGATQKGEGLSAMLYQTERKAYAQFLAAIPDGWLSYDRITNGADHHELGLRVRALRPVFEPLGLIPGAGVTLKQHPGVVEYIRNATIAECAAFVQAAYLADGSTSSGNKTISAQPSPFRDALQMAAYRCGWSSAVRQDAPGGWSTGPRDSVTFRTAQLGVVPPTGTPSVEAVWCVTTESGTFTATGDSYGGMYLTGNSVTTPALQQLPSSDYTVRRAILAEPGNVFVSTDFSSVELRVLAALAGVEKMKQAIADGDDLHNTTARLIYGPDFTAKDRKVAKIVGLGTVYGGGAAGLAKQSGLPVAQVKHAVDAYSAAYPEVKATSTRLQREGKRVGHIVSPWGRHLPIDRDRSYSILNHLIQGSARELLVDAMFNLEDAGLADQMVLPIHDEILAQAPAAEAEELAAAMKKAMTLELRGVVIDADPEVGGVSWGHAYGAPE